MRRHFLKDALLFFNSLFVIFKLASSQFSREKVASFKFRCSIILARNERKGLLVNTTSQVKSGAK